VCVESVRVEGEEREWSGEGEGEGEEEEDEEEEDKEEEKWSKVYVKGREECERAAKVG